jgi:hypothetical protein
MKKVLKDASNLRGIESTSQFGALGMTFITGVDKTQRVLRASVQNRFGCMKYYEVVGSILDKFDTAISTYHLNYKIREESTAIASCPSVAPVNPAAVPGPSAPPPPWIWDAHRNEYYHWSPFDNCYVYASGLRLDSNFQPVAGPSHVQQGQLAVTNEGVD